MGDLREPRKHYYFNCKWLDTETGQTGYWCEPKDRIGSVWFDEDQKINYFMWSEGNYSCDCNRAMFFLDLELGDTVEGEVKCGERRFIILNSSVVDEKGQIIEYGYGEEP